MDEDDGEALADRVSRAVERDPENQSIVAGAVENRSSIASGRSPPLATDRPVEYRSRYYELAATETGRRERTSTV